MNRFDGQVVLVTGASSGIGKAAAIMLGDRGAHVLVAARRAAQSEDTVEHIRRAGGEATFVQMDVADAASVAAGFDLIQSSFGRLDAAFNNAGVTNDFKALSDTSDAEIRSLIETNLYGTVECMRHELRLMRAAGSGVIVNTGSTTSIAGSGYLAVYAATKHAIAGLTKSAALEYAGEGIRINCLCPGGVKTEIAAAAIERDPSLESFIAKKVPLQRMAEPSEIAEVACFMLSDGASFMTGAVVLVDGGQTVGFSVAPEE